MYRKSLVLFTDILGFSELVKGKTDQQVFEILDNFGMPFRSTVLDNMAHHTSDRFTLDELPRQYNELKKTDKHLEKLVESVDNADGKRKCSIFSDNVLVSYDISSENDENVRSIILEELDRIVSIIKLLISRKILSRGGLTIDNLYHGDTTVFGPGLVSAHNIESKLANFPRVCLDHTVVKLLQKAVDTDFQEDFVSEDFDGAFFVDYLKLELSNWNWYHETYGKSDTIDELLTGLLINHHDLIVEKLIEAAGKDHYPKIAWLKNYHNRLLRQFGARLNKHGVDINEFLIQNSEA